MAKVANFIYANGGNIIHADHHTDAGAGLFLSRIEWSLQGFGLPRDAIGPAVEALVARLGGQGDVQFSDAIPRAAIFVSRQSHCLVDLLWRTRAGELPMEVPLGVSNHPDLRHEAEAHGALFEYLPIAPERREAADVLQRTLSISPIDGVVTNLPVRVGETVVPGIQNSSASLIMTIADMSIITAEVKVDETDIVNVKLDQEADVNIDAIPGRTFKGKVIEIGNTAILRSTGLAASQSAISSQEAKDFKVVVALTNPPTEIRPGLSCTAKVITATRQKTLSLPIQALTVRQKGDLEPKPKDAKPAPTPAVVDPVAEKAKREEIQGVRYREATTTFCRLVTDEKKPLKAMVREAIAAATPYV